ncbi:MAG: hypothetical protein E7289_07020 [Lachnospiraceae bacterium]|nr:hypothetical protein [Lachnospiraceae bacterium]
MSNKEYVKNTYDEIHAPEALLGKVMNMNGKKNKIRKISQYAVSVAAALALVFITSNGICYAATGETWVTKAIVYVNGIEQEKDITWHQEGDVVYGEAELDSGTTSVIITDTVGENGQAEVEEIYFYQETDGSTGVGVDIGDAENEDEQVQYLEEKDARIYLHVNDACVDITEDFANGEAMGILETGQYTFQYIVTGDVEVNSIELRNTEEE